MPRRPAKLTYRTKNSLGTDCVNSAWDRIEPWLKQHLPHTHKAVNPPAKVREINAFEQATGLELPAALKESYRRHNGHKDVSAGLIFGLPLLPLDDILDHWKGWKGYETSKKKYDFDELASCFPPEYVLPVYLPATGFRYPTMQVGITSPSTCHPAPKEPSVK